MFRQRFLTSSAVLAVLASAVTVAPAGAAATSSGGTRTISAGGTTALHATATGSGALAQPEIRSGLGDSAGVGTGSVSRIPAVQGPNRSQSSEHGSGSSDGQTAGAQTAAAALQVVTSFNGLNHRQQRLANGGNQFSVEPPDQGLCVGNGFILETVNDVMNVYDSSGTSLKGVTDLNSFYGYPPAIIRSPRFDGPFVTDPSCYFDKATQRWFHVVLTLDVKPLQPHAGALEGSNHLDIAVSQTASPLGTWTIYRIPVQDDGTMGTPNHHCTTSPYVITPDNPNACIGDYPHIGADANGFYITTNEYALFGPEFHGAQLYALSKRALARNDSSVGLTQISTQGLDNGNSGFTLWPAVAPADHYATANRGTEYFLSSNAADEAHGDGTAIGPRTSKQLLVWSLTNTASLDSASPTIHLSHSVLGVGRYAFPPSSVQKVGSTPLRDCLNDASCATTFLLGAPDPHAPNPEYKLDSNDTRMQQVVYANGKLWGALDTAIKVDGKVQAGIEWFAVRPSSEENGAQLVNQGYLAVKRNNVIYPAVAVTPGGQGVIAFTLVGPDHYPSAAFASINAGGTGPVQVAAEGLGPADGFSGYQVYNDPNPNRPRWGDYGAAVVDGSDIWIASEYIGQTCTFSSYVAAPFGSCNGTRTSLGNWYTRITRVHAAQGD
ncbi:MAG: hypothetical protein AUF61_00325 [Chloroflexi bacterium 13_1_20CM_66_33]|nr:MAG: hypothetical protein AUF61_00325 [Chloroflexi bacterium 13_1_20CM_66_33]